MTLLDKIIVIVYVALSVAIGILSRGSQKSVQDYFTASGEIRGGWGTFLVGMSLAAAYFSSITFIAYPSTVYQNGPSILLTCMAYPVSWVILRFWFLPRYFAQGGKTPYQILSDRFGEPTRALASLIFVLLRISWMSTLLYVPTIILLAAAGLSRDYFWPLLLTIGLICTFSSTVGGLRGVMVMDALQFLLISVGLVCVIGILLAGLTRPEISGIFSAKSGLWVQPFRFDLNLTATYSFWTIFLGYSTNTLSCYMADQITLQRYLSLGDVRQASRSFGYNLIGSIAVCVLLATIGVLLRVWYQAHPDPALPTDADTVLPFFVIHQLPIGMIGLFFAALLSATMNCMTSGINSIAGCITNDFIAPYLPKAGPKTLLQFGRGASVLIGLLAIFGVVFIQNLGTVWEICNRITGIFLGPLLAIMLVACLTKFRVSGWSIIMSTIGGCVVGILSIHARINSIWVPFFSFIGTLVLTYALNLGKRSLAA